MMISQTISMANTTCTLQEEEFGNTSLAVMRSDAENTTWINDNSSLYDSASDISTMPNSTMPPSWWSFSSASNYVLATVYWMIFVIGMLGNLLVVAVVIWRLVKSSHNQAVTIFVGSLAVSDLGLLFWVTWTNALLSVNPEWFSGKLHCEMYTMWRSLTAECSIATLMFIALDRCGVRKFIPNSFETRLLFLLSML